MIPLGKDYKDADAMTDGFERLPAGGYICRIEAVEDIAAKNYLDVVYDIAEGPKKGFYGDEWGKAHAYAHHFYMSYKSSVLGMFKGRLKAIDESNGTKFEQDAVTGLDEQMLVGKLVGLVIGYEEYETDRGEVKERSYVKNVCSVDKIRSGSFKVPELKKLEAKTQAIESPFYGFTRVDESAIPF